MGYLNGLINASFKEKDSNTSIFFPYGQFGTGYILSKSEDREAKKFLKPKVKRCSLRRQYLIL